MLRHHRAPRLVGDLRTSRTSAGPPPPPPKTTCHEDTCMTTSGQPWSAGRLVGGTRQHYRQHNGNTTGNTTATLRQHNRQHYRQHYGNTTGNTTATLPATLPATLRQHYRRSLTFNGLTAVERHCGAHGCADTDRTRTGRFNDSSSALYGNSIESNAGGYKHIYYILL